MWTHQRMFAHFSGISCYDGVRYSVFQVKKDFVCRTLHKRNRDRHQQTQNSRRDALQSFFSCLASDFSSRIDFAPIPISPTEPDDESIPQRLKSIKLSVEIALRQGSHVVLHLCFFLGDDFLLHSATARQFRRRAGQRFLNLAVRAVAAKICRRRLSITP